MHNAQRDGHAANVLPKERPGADGGQILQPMVPIDPVLLGGQGMARPFKEHPEIVCILDEFHDLDDDLARAGVRHDPLDLPHFMAPELSQIRVNRGTGLAPQFQTPCRACGSILDLMHGRSERGLIARSNRVADEGEPVV
jgi:hypothetical protein